MTSDEEVRSLIAELAGELNAMGCTADEVRRVAEDQGVALPASYVAFLESMGRDAGGLFGGSDVSYPDVIGLRAAAVELLAENGDPFHLPDDAVVVRMHQGYTFEFMRSSVGADPGVQWWSEGTDHPAVAPVSAASVLDWLRQEMQSSVLAPDRRESHRRSTQATRRLRFQPERCPSCGGQLQWRGEIRYAPEDPNSGRDRMIGDCHTCGTTFWRWADDAASPLQPLT